MAVAPKSRPLVGAGQAAPVATVLIAMAEELEHARALGLRVEGAICAVAVKTTIDSGVVEGLQQLDSVLQRIAALRDYVIELAAQCDPTIEVETASALERVKLEEVRARLAGARGHHDGDGWEML